MLSDDAHISDEELLLLADGELPCQRYAGARAHLTSCWVCRSRMSELESTIANFVHVYRDNFDAQLPSVEGPAALLKATLSRSTNESAPKPFSTFFPNMGRRAATAGIYLTLIVLLVLGGLFSVQRWTVVEASSVPRTDLTPGATRGITRGEACQGESPEANRAVPVALQQAVFKEYGIAHPRASAYEVDYLITPELGGANDIRNLWPEPYFTQVWNARVKDALEERLHEMVCNGQLDLATAQHDISADWIGAYKKYFHTNRPLPLIPR